MHFLKVTFPSFIFGKLETKSDTLKKEHLFENPVQRHLHEVFLLFQVMVKHTAANRVSS